VKENLLCRLGKREKKSGKGRQGRKTRLGHKEAKGASLVLDNRITWTPINLPQEVRLPATLKKGGGVLSTW